MPSVETVPAAPLPSSLLSANPLRWLTVFGPGTIIASLTIGVGELVFSTRAGALFGYRLLWFFALVLVLKWVLVFLSARHIVLTGAHPFQRWMELPGPRGWLPLVFLLLAVPSFPIWVCFHAGTLGTLLSSLTGTGETLRGGAHLVWGMGVLALVLGLSLAGGYTVLERLQLAITLLMLGSVIAALFFLRPDWTDFFQGLLVPQPVNYPPWLDPETHREIMARPVWVETATYVGVIGGSSFDYLAYVSYLRDKRWGAAGGTIAKAETLAGMARDPAHVNRRWLRAVLGDSVVSFVAVLLFTAVFVAGGAMVLGPQHKVPGGSNLLSWQAEFVASAHPWLKPLYFAGAFLAVFGTLYGTLEVAPVVLRELATAFAPQRASALRLRLRRWAVGWTGAGGMLVLLWSLAQRFGSGAKDSPGLVALLTPANLFTGVLGCGVLCLGNVWMERRFLPNGLRAGGLLLVLNLLAALVFLALGVKGYWDHSGWTAFGILLATLIVGMIAACAVERRRTG